MTKQTLSVINDKNELYKRRIWVLCNFHMFNIRLENILILIKYTKNVPDKHAVGMPS